jgi:signal transduction histidine kinase
MAKKQNNKRATSAILQPDFMQRLTFWPLQIGGWALLMVLPLGIWLAGGSSAAPFFWLAFARVLTGFALTSALRPLCGRVFAARLHYAILFPVLVFSSLILGVVELEATCWLGRYLGFAAPVAGADMVYISALIVRSIVLLLWFFLYFGIKSLKRFLEVEREFQKAEVRLLRSQMNPHFLFNALTTIMAVRRDEAKVELVTQSLADYLRFSLQQEQDEQNEVAAHPLGDELTALENYLRVEKVRFSEDLDWRIDAEADALRTLVPSALVQPLLENAIKYRQDTGPRPLRVSITAKVVQGHLELEVCNSGHWVERDRAHAGGVGLKNLRRRLDLIYGLAASLDIRHTEATVRACVSLPARRFP